MATDTTQDNNYILNPFYIDRSNLKTPLLSSTTSSRNSSPSTMVSEMSADSGLASEEDQDLRDNPDRNCYRLGLRGRGGVLSDTTEYIEHDSDITNHIYENFTFLSVGDKNSLTRKQKKNQKYSKKSLEGSDNSLPCPPGQFCDNDISSDEDTEGHPYSLDGYNQDLSLLLTIQNPARIDVGTLKKNKVSKIEFTAFCEDTKQFYLNEGGSNVVEEEGWRGLRKIVNDKSSKIKSDRGTIRGVKNRVREGIATFLQDHSTKNWTEQEEGKCVLYVTSIGIVRETKTRCARVRSILRNMLVRCDERDVFMSRDHHTELRLRLGPDQTFGSNSLSLPQVFLHGQLLGDAAVIERLNESGELRKLLKPLQDDPVTVSAICAKCGGFNMLPCPACSGSKRSGHRNKFNMLALRCTRCDEGGLIRCDLC